MNRRQILQSLAALALPVAAPKMSTAALVGTIRPAPLVPVDWIDNYQRVYRNEHQANVNACHHCMANVGMQAVLVNIMNQAPLLYSWPFAHWRIHQTFDNRDFGSWAWQAAAFREQWGVCVDALFSQDAMMHRIVNGIPHPPPPPECYVTSPSTS